MRPQLEQIANRCSIARRKKLRAFVFRRFDIRKMPHSAVIAFPSVEAVGRLARGTFALAALERRLDCLGNLRGDLVLHRKDIGKVPVVPLGPECPPVAASIS